MKNVLSKIEEEEESHRVVEPVSSGIGVDDYIVELAKRKKKEMKEMDVITKPRWYIIDMRSSVRGWWEMIIVCLAIYNAIITPIGISFDYVRTLQEETWLGTMEAVINAFFGVDIIYGFMTSYIDKMIGKEIFSLRHIARDYIFDGEFFIDFFSTVPMLMILKFIGFEETGVLVAVCDMLSMLKVLRVRKLLNRIIKMDISVVEKSIYQMLFWVFFLFLYTQIIACLMWYFFKADERWIPAVDFGMISSRVHEPYEDREVEVDDSTEFFY